MSTFDKIWATFEAQQTAELSDMETIRFEGPTLPTADGRSVGPGDIEVDQLPHLTLGSGEDDTLSDLAVRATLGEGGMGRVDLAVQRSLRREVAVKSTKRGGSAAGNRALIREALFTGFLEHPNIVPVHQLGRDGDGNPVLVMKRIEGAEWEELIRHPEHPRLEGIDDPLIFHVQILMQVCRAVEFAHSRGILHRDIKPENVMLGDFGEVYLLDWGVSLRLDQRDSGRRAIVGTPAFIAPEMLLGDGEVDERTDLYLLGATLHAAMTGCARHDGENMQQVLMAAHRSEPVVYGARFPTELAALANAATASDPARRPPDVASFRRSLGAFLTHQGSVELCSSAKASLAMCKELVGQSDADHRTVSRSFSECRVAFRESLRQWPDNIDAKAGLQDALETEIRYELAARNRGVVETLIDELPEPRPELKAGLSKLANELAAEAASRSELNRIQTDLDVRVSGRARGIFGVAIGVCVGFFYLLGTIVETASGEIPYHHAPGLFFTALATVLLAIGFWRGRKAFYKTRLNQQLTKSGMGVVTCVFLGRLASTVMDVPLPAATMLDLAIMTTWIAMLAAIVDPPLILATLVWAAGTVVCALLPKHHWSVAAATTALGFFTLAYVWGRRKQPGAAEPHSSEGDLEQTT